MSIYNHKNIKGSFCPLDASPENPYYVIYRTVNLVNGKEYIGFHTLTNHADDYIGSGNVFLRAVRKYGKENFRTEILYGFRCRSAALIMENLIVNDDYVARRNTYNMRTGGIAGWQPGEETREKLRQAQLGKTLSEETREKISRAKQGENNPFFGKIHSEETREKMSQAKLGKSLSEGHREKISRGNLGKSRSQETREKISRVRQGKFSGEKHPRYDPQIYLWLHKDGSVRMETYYQMSKEFGIGIHPIKIGRKKTYKGWSFHGPVMNVCV